MGIFSGGDRRRGHAKVVAGYAKQEEIAMNERQTRREILQNIREARLAQSYAEWEASATDDMVTSTGTSGQIGNIFGNFSGAYQYSAAQTKSLKRIQELQKEEQRILKMAAERDKQAATATQITMAVGAIAGAAIGGLVAGGAAAGGAAGGAASGAASGAAAGAAAGSSFSMVGAGLGAAAGSWATKGILHAGFDMGTVAKKASTNLAMEYTKAGLMVAASAYIDAQAAEAAKAAEASGGVKAASGAGGVSDTTWLTSIKDFYKSNKSLISAASAFYDINNQQLQQRIEMPEDYYTYDLRSTGKGSYYRWLTY